MPQAQQKPQMRARLPSLLAAAGGLTCCQIKQYMPLLADILMVNKTIVCTKGVWYV